MNARAVGPAFVAFAVVAVAVASGFAFAAPNAGKPAFWLLAGGPTVLFAVVGAVWAHREELLREWVTPRWGDFTRGVVSAVLLVAVAWAFTRLVLPVGSPREIWIVTIYGQIGDPRQLQAHAPLVGAVLVVCAVAEEVLWRGAVTQMLADRVGTRTAWIWAAVLYALAYVPTWWALRGGGTGSLDPLLSVGALGAGLLWGAMARAWGRLVPGMIAHVFFDWAVVMMFPLWGPR